LISIKKKKLKKKIQLIKKILIKKKRN